MVLSKNLERRTEIVAGRGTPPGPEAGLLSNTWKWIVQGDTCSDKARDFTGKGHPGREQEGKGTQEDCSATWLAVLGFMVMGLVSGLSSANHFDSESFLVVHALFSQDGCQWGFWEVVGHVVSPFDLSRTLPVGGGLFRVPYQALLSQNNSCKWLQCCLARVGSFSLCASPNKSMRCLVLPVYVCEHIIHMRYLYLWIILSKLNF